ncbi:hypothetical protein J1N35_007711 [Gossypium stocksii]|uniref:Uncharacterized protein n=1 Tax=Gossypium stocksii TaxID=47602 RepID=A0A9D3W920_9ROSI|nr:hypothetical protein J1N35_007711 [Gossypium stocksii]
MEDFRKTTFTCPVHTLAAYCPTMAERDCFRLPLLADFSGTSTVGLKLAKDMIRLSNNLLLTSCPSIKGRIRSLCDFMRRFNVATMVTKGLSDYLAIQAFVTDTTHQFLKGFIISNNLDRLSTLYDMTHNFSKGDEMENNRAKLSIPTPHSSNPP